ncbi:MAG: TlpA family protein disulfide reductase [Dehalococcoidia bacterium]
MNCKNIRPVWPDLQAEYGDEVQLIVVDRDSDAGRAFAESYRINYQPAFVVLDPEGNVKRAALGPYTPGEVRTLVEEVVRPN